VAEVAGRLGHLGDRIGLAERYGVQLGTVTGDYDLATPMGRRFFRIRGADARWESEHRAERVALKHAELRAAGKYWDGQRPFGYQVVPVVVDGKVHHRLELDEPEADLTRAAAMRVLTGGSLSAIVRDWSTRRPPVLRPRGRLWASDKLRELLTSPRIAGLRQNGTDVVEADWPAIITREEHEQLRVILAERPTQKGPKEPREYLASGWPPVTRCMRSTRRWWAAIEAATRSRGPSPTAVTPRCWPTWSAPTGTTIVGSPATAR
jgi:hypothetical protein